MGERGGVGGGEGDARPGFGGEVRAFDGFEVEVEGPGCGGGADGGVAGVGQRAGLAVAEAGDVVFVPAEGLLFGCSEGGGVRFFFWLLWGVRGGEGGLT